MPNGHEEQLKRIREKGLLWSVIWQVGDAAYYLGLLASVIAPPVVVYVGIRHFESWGILLRMVGLAAVLSGSRLGSAVSHAGFDRGRSGGNFGGASRHPSVTISRRAADSAGRKRLRMALCRRRGTVALDSPRSSIAAKASRIAPFSRRKKT